MKKILLSFSCGITSFVAIDLYLKNKPENEKALIVYCKIGSAHKDNERFIKDCEKYWQRDIIVLQNSNYRNLYHYLKEPANQYFGHIASCSRHLKINVLEKFERNNNITKKIIGYSNEKREINRAKRLIKKNKIEVTFPLIEEGLTKENCFEYFKKTGILLPEMYRLGFDNNNCIGCIKGGAKYWLKIKKHFPRVFKQMVELEKRIGKTILKNVYLSELLEEV